MDLLLLMLMLGRVGLLLLGEGLLRARPVLLLVMMVRLLLGGRGAAPAWSYFIVVPASWDQVLIRRLSLKTPLCQLLMAIHRCGGLCRYLDTAAARIVCRGRGPRKQVLLLRELLLATRGNPATQLLLCSAIIVRHEVAVLLFVQA